jgi:hypothetical protein
VYLGHQRIILHQLQTRLQTKKPRRGCSQGSNPQPTQQNTTTNLPVDSNANPHDRSCLQQNINNKPSPDNGKENHNNGGSDSVAVHETCTEK